MKKCNEVMTKLLGQQFRPACPESAGDAKAIGDTVFTRGVVDDQPLL